MRVALGEWGDLRAALVAGLLAALIALGLAGLPPAAILALLVAMGAFALAFLRPFWGLTLALALAPFERLVIPAGVFQLTSSDLLGMAAAAGWLVSRIVDWRSVSVPQPLFAPLVLLLACFVPSTILAQNPGVSIQQFSGWLNFFVLFWMVAEEGARKEVRMLFGALAFAGGLAGALTILDPALDAIGRASGPFGQPNTLGEFLVLAIPIQIYFVFRGQPRAKVLALLGLGLAMYALSVSLSRASWGGIVAMAILLLVWRPFRIALAGLAAVGFVFVALGFNPASNVVDTDKIVDRITSASDPSSNEAAAFRSDVYGAAPEIMLDHPLGVGARNFDKVAGEYDLNYFPFNSPLTSSAENLIFGLGTELGILAVVALIWLCGACTMVLLDLWRSGDEDVRYLALTIAALLISQFVVGMFHYGLHSNVITLSLFAVIGCTMALWREQTGEPPDERGESQAVAETR